MHSMILPFTFIYSSIWEFICSFSILFSFYPLSAINGSTRIFINSESFHFIVFPFSSIFLISNFTSAWSIYYENSSTILNFLSIYKFPMTFIYNTISIFKSTKTLGLDLLYFWLIVLILGLLLLLLLILSFL